LVGVDVLSGSLVMVEPFFKAAIFGLRGALMFKIFGEPVALKFTTVGDGGVYITL